MISIYQNKINNNLTTRDYDGIKKYIDLIQWGRKHPVQFIEKIFGITLMDYQKWLVDESWAKEYVVWACSRNLGKSFLVGCFIMARNLLFPKLQTQIISENWTTANDTFKKMEDIATNNIKTIINTNTVFIDELKRSKSDSDGFTHDYKNGSKCELSNGSKINCVAGQSRTARGKRSNVNVYDEAGFISESTYDTTEPFMSQTSEFKLGSYFDAEVYPPDIPNIRLYVGSASDTSSYFYKKYKDGTKRMLIGDDRYFVADLNCEIPMHPTVLGKPVAPLLSRSEIDRKMRENEIAGNREYFNIFDTFDSEDSVVSRSDIMTNTEVFVPHMSGFAGHKYILAYDPAAKNDNAPVLVTEVFENAKKEICGRFVHMENLVVTYGDGSKRPMRIDEQVDRLRNLIYIFNGKDKYPPYENVTVLLDGGSGGQASAIGQALAKDWYTPDGEMHPGVYDEENEFGVLWAENYKNAVSGCLKIVEPRKFRNSLFEAAKVLVPSGGIKFPPACPKYDILVLDNGEERKLGRDEMASLIQMDLMKEEMVSMVRIKTPGTGNITYQLPPEKRNKMHDDRNYTAVLSCWEILNLRNESEYGDGKELDYSGFINQTSNHAPIDSSSSRWLEGFGSSRNGRSGLSPFQGKSPFKN